MKSKLFKTKKLAEEYISENYPEVNEGKYSLRATYVSEDSDIDVIDMPNLCWSGEIAAWMVENGKCETLDVVAWWEEGGDIYEIYVGSNLAGKFDNDYDAREAYDKAVEEEKYKDEDEEEIFEVKLLCNGEDISY